MRCVRQLLLVVLERVAGHCIRCCAAVILVACVAETTARAEEDLVGFRVGNRSIETLLVHRRQGRFWLPVKEVAPFLSIDLQADASAKTYRLTTPLGTLSLPKNAIFTAHSVQYLDQQFLEQRVNARFTFEKNEAIIVADLPWVPGAAVKVPEGAASEPLVPDVIPPSFGTSTWHGDISYAFRKNSENRFEGNFFATGHAYGGVWQLNYEEDLESHHRIRDAIWLKQLDNNRFVQVGHQTISLHPLLNGVELTGVQGAWTNIPAPMKQRAARAGALMGRHINHQRSFDGQGPVGGRAELWLDGRKYAVALIGLDGRYRFSSVSLPSRQNRIEVLIFDRRNSATPIRRIDKSIELDDVLLGRAQYAVVSAAGLEANGFDRLLNRTGEAGNEAAHAAGMSFARYGVSDNLTVEAGVAITQHQPQVMVGGVGRFAARGLASASVSFDETSGVSYLAEASWRGGAWQANGTSFHRQRGRSVTGSIETSGDREVYDPDWDHYLRLAYTVRSGLVVGVMARHQPEAAYVLPYVRWSPASHVTIDAQPDEHGDYTTDVQYRVSKDSTIWGRHYRNDWYASYQRSFDDDLSFSADVLYSADNLLRFGADISGRTLLNTDLTWSFGGNLADNLEYVLRGSLRKEVREGVQVYATASYASAPSRDVFRNETLEDFNLRIGLAFNLAYAKGELVRASSYGVRVDRGRLAGRIRTANGASGKSFGGIPVLVNNRAVGETAPDGSFYFPNVPVGTHIVEFDDENLPIEHVASLKRQVVKVAPGAVSTVGFRTHVEFGVAGQVIAGRDGKGVANASVVIKRVDGTVAGEAATNQFGYYRIDALRVGTYTAAVRDENGKLRGLKKVRLVNDYVFGLNLKL